MMKVNGVIIPCHSPSQKPGIVPSLAVMLTIGFGPAVQDESRPIVSTNNDTKRNLRLFI